MHPRQNLTMGSTDEGVADAIESGDQPPSLQVCTQCGPGEGGTGSPGVIARMVVIAAPQLLDLLSGTVMMLITGDCRAGGRLIPPHKFGTKS
jgi:hypothetical protein